MAFMCDACWVAPSMFVVGLDRFFLWVTRGRTSTGLVVFERTLSVREVQGMCHKQRGCPASSVFALSCCCGKLLA
jgi:hypothetical protein